MARSSSPIAQYAVLGLLGLFAFNWAEKQPSGSSARNTADQVKAGLGKVFGHAAPSQATQPAFASHNAGEANPAASAPSSGATPLPGGGVIIRLTLVDFGGFPVVFTNNQIEQDPTVGGTNVYSPGDGFVDPSGTTWVWQGGTTFDDGTGNAAQLGQFEAS